MSAFPTRLTNHCETCGIEYRPFQKTQRYCSADCRNKASNLGVREAREVERGFDASALMDALRGWLKPVEDSTDEVMA